MLDVINSVYVWVCVCVVCVCVCVCVVTAYMMAWWTVAQYFQRIRVLYTYTEVIEDQLLGSIIQCLYTEIYTHTHM